MAKPPAHPHRIRARNIFPTAKPGNEKRRDSKSKSSLPLDSGQCPEKPPLDIHIYDRIERDGYTIEKAYFQSLPNFYVGGSLFRPLNPQPKSHPGILSPHGHAQLGRITTRGHILPGPGHHLCPNGLHSLHVGHGRLQRQRPTPLRRIPGRNLQCCTPRTLAPQTR